MSRARTGADAIAHARDLLAPEDGHLAARLDDVERGGTVAELDAVLVLVAGALAGPNRLRALQYRKLAAVQSAARARRAELAADGPDAPAPLAADPPPAPAPVARAAGRRLRPAISWRAWLSGLVPGQAERR